MGLNFKSSYAVLVFSVNMLCHCFCLRAYRTIWHSDEKRTIWHLGQFGSIVENKQLGNIIKSDRASQHLQFQYYAVVGLGNVSFLKYIFIFEI